MGSVGVGGRPGDRSGAELGRGIGQGAFAKNMKRTQWCLGPLR